MSDLEKLFRSSREVLEPREEHRAQLLDALTQKRAAQNRTWFTAHPDYGILTLSASAAAICLFLSVLVSTTFSMGQYAAPARSEGMGSLTPSTGSRSRVGVINYVRTLLPRPEFGDPSLVRAAMSGHTNLR